MWSDEKGRQKIGLTKKKPSYHPLVYILLNEPERNKYRKENKTENFKAKSIYTPPFLAHAVQTAPGHFCRSGRGKFVILERNGAGSSAAPPQDLLVQRQPALSGLVSEEHGLC